MLADVSAYAGEWMNKEDKTAISAQVQEGAAGVIVLCRHTDPTPSDCRSLSCVSDQPPPMTIFILEPRAKWKQGAEMEVTFRSDDPSVAADIAHGTADAETVVAIKQSPVVDIWTMGQSKSLFTVSVGGFSQTFSAANIRNATEPVLRACGDSWGDGPSLNGPKEAAAQAPAAETDKGLHGAAVTYILMVTWFTSNRPPNSYQVAFSSANACEAAKQQVMADAERLKQTKIEQARQLPNFGVEMGTVAGLSAATVSAVCAAQ
jgi:hypothetical protein